MTTYSASLFNATNPNITLAIIPGSYEIRVPQVVLTTLYAAGSTMVTTTASVSNYSSGASGGSSIPVNALRAGSPASTATARSGASGSGTQFLLEAFLSGEINGGSGVVLGNPSFTFQPPFDVIIAPGSALVASISSSNVIGSPNGASISIYFEELRLSWHY